MEIQEKPVLTQCKFIVVRKKRCCRLSAIPGEDFCAEHQPATNKNNISEEHSNLRIVCPLDPKHTCYAFKLKKHLKICNARQGPSLPYIVKGINSGGNPETFRQLSTFSVPEITALIQKINEIYTDLRIKITENLLSHQIVEDELHKPENGPKARKHLKQASAILGLLNEYKLNKSRTCYVEFGAGRGQLTYWLAKGTEGSFLLVERTSPKHKHDNKLDNDGVQRLRADIADLILDQLDCVKTADYIVGVTKHLCGEATDLALRCLSNMEEKRKFLGCLMTFCCHHRCRWSSYTGQQFFSAVGLSRDDFSMMCGMSSWATCGTGFSRNRRLEEKIVSNQRDRDLDLNKEEKEDIGKKAKNILNWGRLVFLEQLGFDSCLHYYVNEDVSLENVCIVARNKEINV